MKKCINVSRETFADIVEAFLNSIMGKAIYKV